MRILFTLLALLLPVSAQETMIRQVYDPATDTHVEVLALFSRPSSRGFFPVRVKIVNNLKKSRSINLDFETAPDYGNKLITRSSFDFSAAPGKTVTRDIMVPLSVTATPHSNQTRVEVQLSGSMGNANNSIRGGSDRTRPSVLMSEALYTPNASKLDSALSTSSGSRYGNAEFAGKFDPKQLPDNWLAFSGYDSLLMTDSDWSNVPPGARNAILSWVRLGGQLVIFSSSNPTPSSLGIPEDTSLGTCLIQSMGSDLMLPPKETLNLVDSRNPVQTQASSITGDYKASWPLQFLFGSQAFHYGIFIFVLIVFGVLVGPINLFVFAKSGQRHRLFLTTPVISLGASLVLIALIIFQDGFGGSGIRRVLMEVRPDAGQNAAFLHQEQFARTGIMTGSRFTVDPACLFSPVPIANSRWARFTSRYNTSGTFNLQPGGSKMQASGDWFQSRSEHGHILTAVKSTRGRIEMGATEGTMVSTFDFPIQTLYYLDDSDQWHRAESIHTGKPFALTPVNYTMAEPALAKEAAAFASRNRHFLNKAKNRRGHFVAITDAAPGIETNPGIHWKATRTVITGPVPGNAETPNH